MAEIQTERTLQAQGTVREYFTAKEVRAGDLPEDTMVWVELQIEQAGDPDRAMEAAVRREDDAGTYKEGTKYMASRPKTWTPTLVVEKKFK